MTGWVAFWVSVAVFIVCECVITLNGIDTLLWKYKTDAEKQIQQAKNSKGDK